MVTESCTPLNQWLQTNKGTEAFENALLWGLYGMLTGLAFLHQNSICHGSLSVDSVFVTAAGDWKLSGFGNTATTSAPGFSASTWRDSYMGALSSTFRAPFLDACLDLQQLPSVDMWGAAIITAAVFSQGTFDTVFKASSDSLRRISLSFVPESLRRLVAAVLSSSGQPPASTVTAQGFLSAAHFKHPMVGALLFLDNLALKEAAQKQKFFKALPSLLPRLPPGVRQGKVLPALMNALEYGAAGGGGTVVLAPILSIGKELPDSEYAASIVPCVVRLFASPDRATRIQLLHHMPEYVHALPSSTLNAEVFTHTMAGFSDTQPLLREATVKAAACMAAHLNKTNVNTVLVRALAKCMVDTVPSVRVNSVIAICTMAPHLEAASRDAVLCRFLGKALSDPLPAARKASLSAMQHVVDKGHVSNTAIASNLLSAAARQCLSASGEVAAQASRTMRACADKLAAAAQATVDAAPSPTAAETHIPTAREHTAAAAAASAPLPAPQATPPAPQQPRAQTSKTQVRAPKQQPARPIVPVTAVSLPVATTPAAENTDWDEFDLDISDGTASTAQASARLSQPMAGAGSQAVAPAVSDGWGDDGWPDDDLAPATGGSIGETVHTVQAKSSAPAAAGNASAFTLKGKAKKVATPAATASNDGWDDW